MLLPAGQERAWSGNYTSLAAATLKAPVEGNRSVPIEIVWARDGSAPSFTVHFNASAQRVSPLSQIAAVHISNIHSTVPVRILFPDTGFEIELGIGLEGFYPVVTNGLEFLAYVPLAPAGGDACTIQVLNFLPPPVLSGGTSSGGGGVGVLRVDTGPGLAGGPITDVGTVSLAVPVAVASGGTGAVTQDAALDALVGASGAATGMVTRDAAGAWNLAPVPSGSGPTLPLVVGQGGTGSTTGFGGLDNLSQAGSQTGALQRAANGTWSLSPAGSGTVTNVLPGIGLQGGGTGPTVTLGLQSPVPVNLGGTGSTTAAGALAAMGGAPLDSPAFTGNPTAPTPAPGDSDNSLATTAFVNNAISGGVGGYLPLTGGTISGSLAVQQTLSLSGRVVQNKPNDGNDAIDIFAPVGQNARIYTDVSGARAWAFGAASDGTWHVHDLTAAALRLSIGTAGQTTVSDLQSNGNVNVPNGYVYAATQVHSGGTLTVDGAATFVGFVHAQGSAAVDVNLAVTGDVDISGQLYAHNAATFYGRIVQNKPNDGNDAITILAPAGQNARVYGSVSAARTWAFGAALDGSWHVQDVTGGQVRLVIATNGQTTVSDLQINGNVNVPNGYVYAKTQIHSDGPCNITAGAVSDPLFVQVAAGYNARAVFEVQSSHRWSVGAVATAGQFQVGDESVGTARLIIDADGLCYNTNGAWAAISDAAIKQDIRPYERGLAAIVNLNPVAFRYAAGTPFATRNEPSQILYGLIADDVFPYIPEVCGETTITVDDDAEQTVSTLQPGNLVYALINAVKELSARVETLEAQLKPTGSTH